MWEEKCSCWTFLDTLGRTPFQRSAAYFDVWGSWVCLMFTPGQAERPAEAPVPLSARPGHCHGQDLQLLCTWEAWCGQWAPDSHVGGIHVGCVWDGRYCPFHSFPIGGTFLISESLFSRKVAASFRMRAKGASSLRKLRSCSSSENKRACSCDGEGYPAALWRVLTGAETQSLYGAGEESLFLILGEAEGLLPAISLFESGRQVR